MMAPENAGAVQPNTAALREFRLEIEEFNVEYARVLDEFDLVRWAEDFFTEDAFYRVTGRENFEAGLPVGLIYCEGKPMLKDRAFAVLETTTFAPRYLLHMNSNARVTQVGADEAIHAQSNYMVLETLVEDKTRIFQAGRYLDTFVRQDGRLLLKKRDCVYDSLIIPNSMIFPV
ncbi:MAG: aromatic-ring-hydroxylating dioxygenase subunit beta [Rhodospirillales bacterium]|jgi:3-phenylpropionate/cinnamic acid dioxygenase small subunit|nr:aromatic-ring-hydroxylating dioxygenase subunit beta [Rhodospirillales bacterium]MDP6772883.1 aromatic-ring-hydroxylating dioxygenase subunit beta [Rhodospirillales bacterium]